MREQTVICVRFVLYKVSNKYPTPEELLKDIRFVKCDSTRVFGAISNTFDIIGVTPPPLPLSCDKLFFIANPL